MIRTLLLILFTVSWCYAGDVQETFLQANCCYKNKKYKKAFDLYSSFEKKGTAVLQNMGNCCFKMNNHIDALLYWKRAEKNALSREKNDIRKNIAVAHEILGYESKRQSFFDLVKDFAISFSLFSLQILFLGFWFLLFASIWFFRRYKIFFLILLLPVNFALGSFLLMKYSDDVYERALVVQSAPIFSGPDKNYQKISSLSCADECLVLEQRDNWCKVKSDRLAGWVCSEAVKIL